MSYILQTNTSLQNTLQWKDKYRNEAIAKAKLGNTNHSSIYEEFENWRNWVQYASSLTPKRSSSTLGGGTWELNAPAGNYIYYHLGRAANSTGFNKVIKAKQKWHIAVRLKITSPSSFPIAGTQRLDSVGFESGYGTGPSIAMGLNIARSTTKWSMEGDSGTALLSTKNLSNLWTTLEMWCDTTNIFFQVTDTTGTETPLAYSDFGSVSDTLRGMAIYNAVGSGAAMTTIIDKILVTTPLQTT